MDSLKNHVLKLVQASDEALDLFASKLQRIAISKKRFLLQPGTQVQHEYFVLKGCLKTYYLDKKGNEHIIQFAIENWWLGDFDAFYNGGTGKFFIEALEDSELLAIDYNSLQEVFEKEPVFERYFRILITGAFIAQRRRILDGLSLKTKGRYLQFCEAYPNIETRVPNYQIANYLGVSAENLSRVRRKLKS
ncbi:Crp/Fnr family transcriptional regulator [Gilvibacter sediminis]|uniref:Crp/Fnr family transcriptional regulator n=1 Tax=Gilvibacter sediminis TaxID=379071 RepID=UPI002350B9EC|nr:Crp/Fnr family transcriptional regulator [Gilvibacter sediminis]MDC7998301.1 Crp/Fnr family transcriptional regulator [Gilvibacter sediminis]